MKPYSEIMEHLRVTPEMRERVLAHIAAPQKKTPSRVLRQGLAVAACLAVIAAAALVLPRLPALAPPIRTPGSASSVSPPQISYVKGQTFSTRAELEQAAAFPIALPASLPFEADTVTYLLYNDGLVEVAYSGGEQELLFRKNTGDIDVSGNFQPLDILEQRTINGCTFTIKGDSEGFTLAIWFQNGCAASLQSHLPLSLSEWETMLASLS